MNKLLNSGSLADLKNDQYLLLPPVSNWIKTPEILYFPNSYWSTVGSVILNNLCCHYTPTSHTARKESFLGPKKPCILAFTIPSLSIAPQAPGLLSLPTEPLSNEFTDKVRHWIPLF